jgi:hypothetical protein
VNGDTATQRLFLPLSTAPFQWFKSGKKRWELRRCRRQFTERQVVPGRRVELRRGYQANGEAIWGVVRRTLAASSLADFFDNVPFELVIPTAATRTEATEIAASILGVTEHQHTSLLGFEIDVEAANE